MFPHLRAGSRAPLLTACVSLTLQTRTSEAHSNDAGRKLFRTGARPEKEITVGNLKIGKAIGLALVLCVATAISSSAQTLTTLSTVSTAPMGLLLPPLWCKAPTAISTGQPRPAEPTATLAQSSKSLPMAR